MKMRKFSLTWERTGKMQGGCRLIRYSDVKVSWIFSKLPLSSVFFFLSTCECIFDKSLLEILRL